MNAYTLLHAMSGIREDYVLEAMDFLGYAGEARQPRRVKRKLGTTLLIAAVISAELFNTSLETVCDLITKERSCYIRIAKDISAAAVLVFALAATAVAVVFFWNAAAFAAMFKFFAANPILPAALVLSAVIAVFFVALGPREIWDRISKKRKPKG